MDLTADLIRLVVGFVLTTIVGGWIANRVQNRTWQERHDQERREALRAESLKTFDAVSTLLDRRLYRMKRLNWGLAAGSSDIEARMHDYTAAVIEWNDVINRNRALIYDSFGKKMHDFFDNELGREYVQLGERLEKAYKGRDSGRAEAVLEARLDRLATLVYTFNNDMLKCINEIVSPAMTNVKKTRSLPRQLPNPPG